MSSGVRLMRAVLKRDRGIFFVASLFWGSLGSSFGFRFQIPKVYFSSMLEIRVSDPQPQSLAVERLHFTSYSPFHRNTPGR